jgi:transposase
MARPKSNIDAKTVARAEEALEKIKDSKLSVQLKAIIAAAEHPVENVATILKVSVRSIFRWIEKFKEQGVEGLRDRPKGHMRSKLTEDHKGQLEQWIVRGKNVRGQAVHWTLKKLRRELGNNFGVHIGTTPLWKHLKKMDLVLKKPRPIHAKADRNAQEAFKKT